MLAKQANPLPGLVKMTFPHGESSSYNRSLNATPKSKLQQNSFESLPALFCIAWVKCGSRITATEDGLGVVYLLKLGVCQR